MLYQTDNPHGGDLYTVPVRIDFSANINPYGTPEHIKKAVRDCADEIHQYPDTYCRELIASIAGFEKVRPEHILCGSGAAEVIFLLCMAAKPARALLLAPTFSEYETALRACGCTDIIYYDLSEDDGFGIGEDILDVIVRERPELVMICNPNNPTGKLCDRLLMNRIYELCRDNSVLLFVDECFLDLTQGGDGYTMKGKLDEYAGLFILKAFTKSFGMAGLRLGYCLCSDHSLLKAMSSLSQPWNISIPAQRAGTAALSDTSFLEKANSMVHSQRPLLAEALRKLGMKVIDSRANYLLFYSPVELKENLLKKGILIRNCDNYRGLGKGWYRVAVKLPEENAELLRCMEEVLGGR